MKIITVNVNKGGAGKTTLSFNMAEYMRKESRVLLLDFDDSANLTNRYGYFQNMENTVIDLFDKKQVTPIHAAENLDLIAGHREVELLKERLSSRRRREYIFGSWLAENEEWLADNYDYIIIDTENDEGILTLNAIVVSDVVIGVAEASKDSFLGLVSLRKFVTDLNKEFEGNTQLLFVANKISNDNPSKDLIEDLSEYEEYAGYMPQRTILKDNKSIFSSKNYRDKAVANQMAELFAGLKAKFDEVSI
ncbi:ParA family protein [Weissella muntiaci]|uniref:ParA family protein n=1 Tax=Weissella muntiaci TaxID=2508881 RepID=A0A6C2C1V6_9LACO|nr:ParA family protein [Weissella muntiaci]TYC47991.1 ParA family protein [Weissella muntiaci]